MIAYMLFARLFVLCVTNFFLIFYSHTSKD